MADRIIRDIASEGWHVRSVLGSEAELQERYDISRAVFRESVRLLEHLGVATTRRGPGGGLVVTEPTTSGVVQAFMLYLTYAGMSLGDLIEARTSLETAVARLAAERIDEEQIELLRQRARIDLARDLLDAGQHHVLHTMIAHAAANPAAELFVDVLGRLTARWSYPTVAEITRIEALDASARAHERIVDAIAAGDASLAERRMTSHLGALGDWLGRQRLSPRSLHWVLDDSTGEEKLGRRIAQRVIVDIVDRDWPIGEVIGSEHDLIGRYDVSRSALREAVRLLEYHEVATMKRGPGGGLVVTAPGIGPIVRVAAVFLDHRGITAGDLIALRRDLESEAVALAARHATDDDLAVLRAALRRDAEAGFEAPVDGELHGAIAQVTGNAAIALFVRVLVQLTRDHARVPRRRSAGRADLNNATHHAHVAIVDAIERHDAALARRRMVAHLAAMEPLLH